MLTRRKLLHASIATVIVAPALANETMRTSQRLWSIHYISLDTCPAGKSFGTASCTPALRIGNDIGDALQMVATYRDGDRPDVLVGLARSSDHFVLQQFLMERGYREAYGGSHRLLDGKWRHSLHGKTPVVESIAARLTDAGDCWPRAIAEGFVATDHWDGPSARTVRNAKALCKPHDPAYLISWAFLSSDAVE